MVVSQIAYHYRLDMRIFAAGARHLHRELANFVTVASQSRLDLAIFVPVSSHFCAISLLFSTHTFGFVF